MKNNVTRRLLGLLTVTCLITSCGKSQEVFSVNSKEIQVDEKIAEDLSYQYREELAYADQFAIDYYGEGYTLLTISDGSRFLIVDEQKNIPQKVDEDIKIIHGGIQNTYLVATAAMDMFVHLDALDCIKLSGTDADGWHIEEAKNALLTGDIVYAGKYNAPDYERIVSATCDLAIESTMIFHNPEVKEKLESFGIPVLVDHASYELHPLGRMEWIKLYGVLTGKKDVAEQIFDEEVSSLQHILQQTTEKQTQEKTVAFFYITSNGAVNVRKTSDYVPQMISMAGGSYIFDNLSGEDNHSSSTTMQMEEFYAKAKDADYLIYNSSIDAELNSVEDLLGKSNLFAEFKAVQNGNVWCASKNLYQESMSTVAFILDINQMLMDEQASDDKMHYLYHLK